MNIERYKKEQGQGEGEEKNIGPLPFDFFGKIGEIEGEMFGEKEGEGREGNSIIKEQEIISDDEIKDLIRNMGFFLKNKEIPEIAVKELKRVCREVGMDDKTIREGAPEELVNFLKEKVNYEEFIEEEPIEVEPLEGVAEGEPVLEAEIVGEETIKNKPEKKIEKKEEKDITKHLLYLIDEFESLCEQDSESFTDEEKKSVNKIKSEIVSLSNKKHNEEIFKNLKKREKEIKSLLDSFYENGEKSFSHPVIKELYEMTSEWEYFVKKYGEDFFFEEEKKKMKQIDEKWEPIVEKYQSDKDFNKKTIKELTEIKKEKRKFLNEAIYKKTGKLVEPEKEIPVEVEAEIVEKKEKPEELVMAEPVEAREESDFDINIAEENGTEKEPQFDLKKTRDNYAKAYVEYHKVYHKKSKEFLRPGEWGHVIKVGDSERYAGLGTNEERADAIERKNKFIKQSIIDYNVTEKQAEVIYEIELKRVEYEAAKEEMAKKMAAEGIEKEEIFKKLFLNEREVLNQAKVESWPPKEKGIFRKGIEWYLRQNTATRLLISTGLITGAVAAVGGFSAPAAAIFAGHRFARGFGSVAIGKLAGKGVDWIMSDPRVKKEIAMKKLESSFSLDNLKETEKELEKILEENYKRERNKLLFKGLVSVMAGAGTAMGLNMLEHNWASASEVKIAPETLQPKAPTEPVASAGLSNAAVPSEPVVNPAVGAEGAKKLSEVLVIGNRGPEGSIIDYFKANPEAAKSFGWNGEVDLNKWAGIKAHALWLEDAKEALAKPETLEELKKLGYSQDIEGYGQMMRRIGKGAVEINSATGKIDLVGIDYLRQHAPSVISSEPEVFADATEVTPEEITETPVVEVTETTPEAAVEENMPAEEVIPEEVIKLPHGEVEFQYDDSGDIIGEKVSFELYGKSLLGRDYLMDNFREKLLPTGDTYRLSGLAEDKGKILSQYLGAYKEMLAQDKESEAKYLLKSVHKLVGLWEKDFPKGVFDHSKIPGLENK